MEGSKFLVKYLGSLIFGISIFMIVIVLLLGNIDKQMNNIDVITNDVVNDVFLSNKEEILMLADQNENYLKSIGCETLDCPDLENDPLIIKQLNEISNEVALQLSNLYQPFKNLLKYRLLVFILSILLFFLSLWMIYFSLDYDKQVFVKSLTFRLWIYFFFLFILSLIFILLKPSMITHWLWVSLVNVPQVFIEFSATLLLNILQPAVRPFVYIMFALMIIFFIIWIVIYLRHKKKNKKHDKKHRKKS